MASGSARRLPPKPRCPHDAIERGIIVKLLFNAKTIFAAVPDSNPLVRYLTAAERTHFEVFRDGYLLATKSEQRFVDRMVRAGIGYTYNVRACNDDGCATGCSPTTRAIILVSQAEP